MQIPNSKKKILPNGLRVVTEEIPSLRSIAMGIMVGAGPVNETAAESGISHLIEHMLFKGTSKRSAYEIAHALDAVGGKMNAYTAKEQTMYYAVVLDKHLDTAIDVLCDIYLNSLFNPKETELEKGVILEEIKMYEDTPDELIHDLFAQKILQGHPAGKSTLGTSKTVKSFKKDDILNYINTWYSPKNTIVSLAGDLPKDIDKRIADHLGDWKSKHKIHLPPAPKIEGTMTLKHKKTEQVHLCLGVKGLAQTDEDFYPYAVLDSILGGSMSSRLFQEVREKRGLAYSIYSTSASFRNFGIAYVYAGTSKENLEKVVNIILEEFSKIKKQGVTEAELEKAREYLKGTLVLGLESTISRMSWLAKSEYHFNRCITVDEIFAKVDKITNENIIRLANRFFQDKYLTLAVIGDLKKLPFKKIHC
ncbi:MAG: insulinase family protein [Candidatus Margulisbacteria bacterium]|nr:insulinase family protein [Candidatus Margulisiibacteriota bacterium]